MEFNSKVEIFMPAQNLISEKNTGNHDYITSQHDLILYLFIVSIFVSLI
jgi:hypothetical protein